MSNNNGDDGNGEWLGYVIIYAIVIVPAIYFMVKWGFS